MSNPYRVDAQPSCASRCFKYGWITLVVVVVAVTALVASHEESRNRLRQKASAIASAALSSSNGDWVALSEFEQYKAEQEDTVYRLKEQIEALAAQITKGGKYPSSNTAPVSSSSSTDLERTVSDLVTLTQVLGPLGKSPKALPPVEVTKVKTNSIYDGAGVDPSHIGGSTVNDTMGQSPALWNHLLKNVNVRSVIDVGCGRGISTKWFLDHGADVLCVEGGSDAIKHSHLPRDKIVQHDFSRGPWWPEKTFDLAWSVEVMEHIGRNFAKNYLPLFKRAAIVFITFSRWGGHHHVEVRPDWWWISRFEAAGFVHSPAMTQRWKSKVSAPARSFFSPDSLGDRFNSQHLRINGLAFINPAVASRYEHAHLFGGPGCWGNGNQNVLCGGSDLLPDRFLPVFRTPTPWDDKDAEKMNVLKGVFHNDDPWKQQRDQCKRDYGPPWSHDGCDVFDDLSLSKEEMQAKIKNDGDAMKARLERERDEWLKYEGPETCSTSKPAKCCVFGCTCKGAVEKYSIKGKRAWKMPEDLRQNYWIKGMDEVSLAPGCIQIEPVQRKSNAIYYTRSCEATVKC